MAKKIAICNQKGGVAKTATTFNLAINITELTNKKVLLIDGDMQGDLTSVCGFTPYKEKVTITEMLLCQAGKLSIDADLSSFVKNTNYTNVDLVPCNMEAITFDSKISGKVRAEELMKNLINSCGWDDKYDYILFDCPPALTMITTNILVAADEIIIPVDMVEAVRNLKYLLAAIDEAKLANPNLKVNGILFVKQEERTNLHKTLLEETEKNYDYYIYRSKIRKSTAAATAMGIRVPLIKEFPKEKVTQDYIEFTAELMEREA